MIGVTGKKRVVISTNAGGAYSSELKLVLPIVDEIKQFCTDGFFVADKCYDSVELMSRLNLLGIKCAIKVKETIRVGVKNEMRKLSKFYSEKREIYGKRYLIESLFGTIKQKLSSHIKVKRDDIAMRFALIRVLIFNLHALFVTAPLIFFVLVCSLTFCLKNPKQKNLLNARLPLTPHLNCH